MKLKTYLRKNQLTCEQMARKTGLTTQTIRNVINRYGYPSIRTVQKITKATKNDVSYNDLTERR